jgi:hypothetical protein
VVLEQGREGLEPADDVLGRVGAVDAQDELAALVAEGLAQGGGVLGHLGGGGQLAHGGDVDRDRVVAGRHHPVADPDRHRLQVDRQPEQLLGRQQKVAGEPLGVEGDHVVAEQAVEHALAPGRGQHPPGVRAREGDVQEERQHGLGAALPDLPGDQVEVVVVEHDQGPPAAGLDLGDHRVGEQPVDGHIAVVPGGVLALGQHRRQGQAVHAVLEEPQQRVGDHRVEVVVGLLVDLDQPQAHGGRPLPGAGVLGVQQPRLGLEGDLYGAAVVLGGHGGVLLGGGGAHPDGVGQVRHQAGQGRDQPAGPAAGRPAGFVAPERHRPAVRQQDHRQLRRLRPGRHEAVSALALAAISSRPPSTTNDAPVA